MWSKISFGFSSYNQYRGGLRPAHWSHSRLKAGSDRVFMEVTSYLGNAARLQSSPIHITSKQRPLTLSSVRRATVQAGLCSNPSLITSKALWGGSIVWKHLFLWQPHKPYRMQWTTQNSLWNLYAHRFVIRLVFVYFFPQQKCSLQHFGRDYSWGTVRGR